VGTVLAVDDYAVNLEVLVGQFEILGVPLDTAADGIEALTKWREKPYALVLTDIHMPDMDGFELTRQIRSEEALDAVMATGADRVLLGTKAFTDPDFLDRALAKYGDRVAVALDAYDGIVAVNGWQEATDLKDIDAAKELVDRGVKTILYTDIGSDGKLNGPNLERMKALREAVSVTIIASGGVTTEADVEALQAAGIDEAVVGKALLSGQVSLDDLIEWEARHA